MLTIRPYFRPIIWSRTERQKLNTPVNSRLKYFANLCQPRRKKAAICPLRIDDEDAAPNLGVVLETGDVDFGSCTVGRLERLGKLTESRYLADVTRRLFPNHERPERCIVWLSGLRSMISGIER